jgi:hypothetical protein
LEEPQLGFDISNLHIPDDSAAARVIQQIVAEEHVSAAEAVCIALERLEIIRAGSPPKASRSRLPLREADPEEFIGMFENTPGFREAIDSVIAGREERYRRYQRP